MQITPVKSSNVQHVAYDEQSGQMHVTFKSGATYAYDVPREIHDALIKHPSPGSFIRDFKGVKVS
jgi:hypothetical protein